MVELSSTGRTAEKGRNANQLSSRTVIDEDRSFSFTFSRMISSRGLKVQADDLCWQVALHGKQMKRIGQTPDQ